MTYTFSSNLLKIHLAAGKDPRRHALHRVEIAFGAAGVTCAATDGRMLAVSSGGLPMAEKDATTFLILASTAKNILLSCPAKGTDITIQKTDDGTKITFISKTHVRVMMLDKPEELNFAPWQDILESCKPVIGSTRAGVYAVKPALLCRALDIIGSYVGKEDGDSAIIYTPPAFNKAIYIEAQDSSDLGDEVESVKCLVMPTGIPDSHHAKAFI